MAQTLAIYKYPPGVRGGKGADVLAPSGRLVGRWTKERFRKEEE